MTILSLGTRSGPVQYFSVVWRFGRTRYEIAVANPEGRCRGIADAELDGIPVDPGAIPLADYGRTHRVRMVIGDAKRLVSAVAKLGAIAPA